MPFNDKDQMRFLEDFQRKTDLLSAEDYDRSIDGPLVDAAVRIADGYRGWSPTIADQTLGPRLEVFAPRSFDLVTAYGQQWKRREAIDVMRREWSVERWKRQILHLCLYVDSLWLPDPIELIASGVADANRMVLGVHETLIAKPYVGADMASVLTGELAPLIEMGVIRLYPAITHYKEHVSGELFGEVRSFTANELRDKWPDGYVHEGLLYANAFDASYVALDTAEFEALVNAMREVANAAGVADQRVIAMLPRLQLPYFERLDAKGLVSVRKSEEVFADFRSFLKETSRILLAGVEDPKFESEVRELERDFLMPTVKKLDEDLRGVSSLRDRISDGKIDFLAGALGDFAVTAVVLGSLTTAGATTLATALMKMLLARKPVRPAARAVYQFHTGKRFGFGSW